MDRRRFLGVVGAAPAWFAACATGGAGAEAPSGTGVIVNDVHSGRNPTRVARVLRPTSLPEVRAAVVGARRAGVHVAVAGGRHAMGGQQFLEGGWLLDLTHLDRIVSLDSDRGHLTVGGGNTWPRVLDFLSTTWADDGTGWTIVQKPSGVDDVTIGGSLASNVHGSALGMPPVVADVERIAVIDARGNPLIASREEDANLFGLAIGGYGLFGPVVEATLRLQPREKVQAIVSEEEIDAAVQLLRDRTVTGDLYGEFHLAVDEESYLDYLREGVLVTWRREDLDVPVSPDPIDLGEEEWVDWMMRAHLDPRSIETRYFERLLETDGQVRWTDEIQRAAYRPGYHAEIESRWSVPAGSETLAELFLPTAFVSDFLSAARAVLRTSTTPVTRCSIRMIEEDDTTFLAWARRRFACVEFELHVDDSHAGREVAAATIRELIDEALEREGTFYLTYDRSARIDQVRAAYPRFDDFLRFKRVHDPDELFQSDWYRYWRERAASA